ncbi:phosphatidyl synthase [Pyricularia oryzae Y34]|nr:phosphatidyl synthase [Pyricularia oryzae Y34]
MQRLSASSMALAGGRVSPSSVLLMRPMTMTTTTMATTACSHNAQRILSTLCRPASRSLLPAVSQSLLLPQRSFSITRPWLSLAKKEHKGDGQRGTTKQQPKVVGAAEPLAVTPASGKSALARENIYTIPNILTASRLVIAPFIGYCIVHDYHATALGLFAYAGVSDLLDGWIARRWNQGTVVGTIIDPMADKMLMMILTVSLAVKGALPLWLVTLIVGRDVGLACSAIYYRWVSLPPPKTFMRYWDFSLPSAEVRPTTISKYNTFLQLALMGLTTTAPVVPYDLDGALAAMHWVVAVTTVWSGASYVFSKDAVKILSQAKAVDKKLK